MTQQEEKGPKKICTPNITNAIHFAGNNGCQCCFRDIQMVSVKSLISCGLGSSIRVIINISLSSLNVKMKHIVGRQQVKNPIFNVVIRIFFPLVLLWSLFVLFSFKTFRSNLRGSDPISNANSSPHQNFSPSLNRKNDMRLDHLIVVAGHAVMRLDMMAVAETEDKAWYLLPYQIEQGFPEIIRSHVIKGIEIAGMDASSILIFSGGQTRKDVGPTSEGASYYYLAQQMKLIGGELQKRVFVEEYARDSYENLLFSICRFKEVSGVYPSKITVVGFDFKSTRFNVLHRKAIGFPDVNFSYVGLRPENHKFNNQRAEAGEKLAIDAFTKDMYACNTESLYEKRLERDPFRRTVPYELACPEIKNLLSWCGPNLFDSAVVPWGSPSANAHLVL